MLLFNHIHFMASIVRRINLVLHFSQSLPHFLNFIVLVAQFLLTLLANQADLSVEWIDFELQLWHTAGIFTLIIKHLLVSVLEMLILGFQWIYLCFALVRLLYLLRDIRHQGLLMERILGLESLAKVGWTSLLPWPPLTNPLFLDWLFKLCDLLFIL